MVISSKKMGALVATVLGSCLETLSLVMYLLASFWHRTQRGFRARHWCSGSQTHSRTNRKSLTLLGILKCLHTEFTFALRKYGSLA